MLGPELRKNVEEAIQSLTETEDPRKLGHKLHGRWNGSYSFEIGTQYRIIYHVDFTTRVIQLMAAGTHKICR